jgi:Flp pilus assembly pilin Flp
MRRADLRSERGVTVMETTIVVALLAVVLLMAVSTLMSTLGTSAAAHDRVDAITDVRTALETLERDVRAANPISLLPAGTPVSTYANSVSFSVYCSTVGVDGCASSHLRSLTYDVTANGFYRTAGGTRSMLMGPSGPSGLAAANQRGAVVNPAARPVFEYLDADGATLDSSTTSPLPTERFRDCTKQLRVTLVVVTAPGTTPRTADLTTSATLRNFHEVAGC